MPLPHRHALLLLEIPAAASFFPLSPDPKHQLIYNSAKVLAKTTIQKKHIIQAIQESYYGDFTTICNNFANCKNEGEMSKALAELAVHVSAATFTTPESAKDIGQLAGAAVSATQTLAEYEAKAAMLKAASDKCPFFPPELKEFIDELNRQRQRPETFSLMLRLRGPKLNATSVKIKNKPPSEDAIDRWWKFGGRGNSTNVNNINRGGGQLNKVVSLKGGHQTTVGIDVEELKNHPTMLDKLASLIVKNHRKL